MRTIAIIQARMGSNRLPGKVLCDIAGASMLARVVERVRAAATSIDDVVIATSTSPGGDPIVAEGRRLEVHVHRGSENDVLARYLGAAHEADADAIVRVTADCPLLDPSVISQTVAALTPDVDYASNTHTRSYPRGLDVEILHRDVLDRIGRLATTPPTREHVTSFVLEQPGLFRVRQICAQRDDSDLRWTVDTREDLALVRAIYERFGGAKLRMGYRDLVDAVRAAPELLQINHHVVQKHWGARAS